MRVIKPFDPWQGKWCSCPPKYTLNPYTGCAHRCLYCYTTSFIPRAFEVREKPDILKKIEKDLEEIDPSRYLSLSNSSDPYPPEEEKRKLTREILKLCQKKGVPVLILTKSTLVTRDIDILKAMKIAVSITITTFNPHIASLLEEGAPSPLERARALIKLHEAGIPTILRIDPLIPETNDKAEDWEEILSLLSPYINQVVVSTFKPRLDSWKRITTTFPSLQKTKDWYVRKRGNNFYLEDSQRIKLLEKARATVHSFSLPFSSCREGIPAWNDVPCDGSGFIKNQSIKSISLNRETSLEE
ncbi:MAG: radical SAM protein [Candidatus Atribacteria bacterium]|nr:radical SAM protein [Candidatus Atribacteria bacterium]